MKKLYYLLPLIFLSCSQEKHYFSLELREDSLGNISQSTPFDVKAISSSLLGFEVQKVHSISGSIQNSLILVQKNSQDVAYIYGSEDKISSIEIVHPNVNTKQALHVGVSLKEAKEKSTFTCKADEAMLTCKQSKQTSLEYHFTKATKKLEYIVLILN